MKRRINLIAAAILIMLGAIIWILIRGQRPAIIAAAAPLSAPAPQVQVLASPTLVAIPPAAQAPAVAPPVSPSRPPAVIRIDKTGDIERIGYTAVAGDTLSDLAAALLGSDSKANRDAVVAANPALQTDPDRVLMGTTYFLAALDSSPQVEPIRAPATQPQASTSANSDRVLTYTAQPGDSVSALAAGLLGGNSKTNRDAIVNKNQSLQDNPDKVVVGKMYQIPTKNGLSAADAPAVEPLESPTTRPNDDDMIDMAGARELRYTALAGDTVSKLATVLLESDTPANRDAIINSNPSLKSDPDKVIAGKTYWIPAPTAAAE